MHAVYQQTTKTRPEKEEPSHAQRACSSASSICASAHASESVCVFVCMHCFEQLDAHLKPWVLSSVSALCRSINNVTLSAVKQACVSGEDVKGEEEEKETLWDKENEKMRVSVCVEVHRDKQVGSVKEMKK